MIVNKLKRVLFLFYGILFSPVFFYLIRKRKEKLGDNYQLRVLIIPQLTRIGDLVCATPVFRAIKEKYPGSFLAVLASKKNADIIRNNPHIDEIIIFRNIELLDVIRKIKESVFNWCFCLSGTSFGTLLAVYGLIPNRAKIIKPERPASETLTDWMSNYRLLYRHHTYLPAYYLKMLEFIGVRNAKEIKGVFTTPATEKKATEFLFKNGVNKKDLLVAMSITAGNRIKEWGDDNFKALSEKITENYGTKIVFIGSKKDEQRIDGFIERLKNKERFMKAVNFSLEELPSLIKRANLFISVDTGPVYIAHALGVPLIDIVGPCDPNEQPPQDESSILVCPPKEIKPSSFVFKKPGSREEQKKALTSISVADVLAAVDQIIIKKIFR